MMTLEQAYADLELGKKWCPGCCGARVPKHWTQADCPKCERDRALLEQMDDDMQRACER